MKMTSKPYKSTATGFFGLLTDEWFMQRSARYQWLYTGLCIIWLEQQRIGDGPDRQPARKKISGQPRPDSQPDGSQRRPADQPSAPSGSADRPTVDHPGRGYPDPEAGGPNRARLPAGAGTVAL